MADERSEEPTTIGAAWIPSSPRKYLCSGTVTVNGMKQKFYMFPNDKKAEGSRQPDYRLVSWDEPERDDAE